MGLSTASPVLAATMAEDSGKYHDLKVLEVDQCRLSDLADFTLADLYWMKIDVEGFEQQVLGGGTTILRPWILVVEATVPTQISLITHAGIIILDAGYQCV